MCSALAFAMKEKQMNAYLCPEGYDSGNSECVISMLQQFFQDNPDIDRVRTLYVYSDSCSGQNRNNFGLAFWISRVLDGKHEVVSWNFLVVGHTKFSPDRLFGLLRSLERKFNLFTPQDWKNKANGIGTEDGWRVKAFYFEDGVFRAWKSLADPFKRFEGIKNMPIAEIRLSATYEDGRAGCRVEYRLLSDDVWHNVAILRRDTEWPTECLSNPPPFIGRVGFSKDRKAALVTKAEQLTGITTRQLRFWRELPVRGEIQPEDAAVVVEEEPSEAPSLVQSSSTEASVSLASSEIELEPLYDPSDELPAEGEGEGVAFRAKRKSHKGTTVMITMAPYALFRTFLEVPLLDLLLPLPRCTPVSLNGG